jgi:hypothetical protein
MSIPAQFAYTYESKQQLEKPVNNASHMSVTTRDDPNFKWQNSGQKTSRGQTIWVRATKRRVTPEYKAFLAAEKTRRESELDILSKLIGQMTMVSSAPGSNGRGNYATSLITGKPSYERKQEAAAAAAHAAQLKAEINMISAMLSSTRMDGGRKSMRMNKNKSRAHRYTVRKN